MKMRKCRKCGRMFVPKSSDEHFCSCLCRMTGYFLGGGGDTSKPENPETRRGKKNEKAIPPSPKPTKVRNGAEKFPRVHRMFSLPVEERWELAKQFTPEETEYGRRLAKRMLAEESRIDMLVDWDAVSEEGIPGGYDGIMGGSLGDSDDGTI